MMASDKLQALYVSVPKCGTRANYEYLSRIGLGFKRVGGFHECRVPDYASSWFCYTMIRNPYSRAVSIWWRGHRAPGDKYSIIKKSGSQRFDDFLDAINREQWIPLVTPAHKHLKGLVFDAILRLEDDDINRLPFAAFDDRLPMVGASDDGIPRVRDILNGERIRKINQWAGADFEMGGYVRKN